MSGTDVTSVYALDATAPMAEAATSTTFVATDTAADTPLEPREAPLIARGAVLGRYIVAESVGAGAMGVVLAAYDPKLDRKVALKLLKLRGEDTNAQARLEREALALAKLDHPNVVRVYDVGNHGERLFVAMEFVPGCDLRTWFARASGLRPRAQVLAHFLAAGRGLAAAHNAGLIHRDFKPANVMLGEDGRVRVMDFGLVRALEDSQAPIMTGESPAAPNIGSESKGALSWSMTVAGSLVGTPAYMSPEQLAGMPATAASDQFGFCVALYEALYGERPFAAPSLSELLATIQDQRLSPPPKRVLVPSWLRAVVLRGLRADPQARWPSMDALLDALSKDPALRRRRWAAGVAIIGLLAGSGWALVSSARAHAQSCTGFEHHLAGVWDTPAREQVRASLEQTGLSYASETSARVEAGLDRYIGDWLVARQRACEATQRGEQSAELLDLRMACLDERLAHVRSTVELLTHSDAESMAKAVMAVAELPKLARCEDLDALGAEQALPEDPELAARVRELDAQLIEARASKQLGHYGASFTLAAEVSEAAQELGYEPLLVRAWLLKGLLQETLADYAQAESSLRQAHELALVRRMVPEAAAASSAMTRVLGERLARYDDALRWAEEHARPWARAEGSVEARARHLHEFGLLRMHRGEHEAARALLEQTLALEQTRLGAGHPSIARIYSDLGALALKERDFERARPLLERAAFELEGALGPGHPNNAIVLNKLAVLAAEQRDPQRARELFERALAIDEQALGPDHPRVAGKLGNLGYLALDEGDPVRARELFTRALTIKEANFGPAHPSVARTLSKLADLARAERNYEQAYALFSRALAIEEEAYGVEHPEVVASVNNLATVASELGRFEEARALFERALLLWDVEGAEDDRYLAYPLRGLGKALLELGEPARALPLLERALELLTTLDGSPSDLSSVRFALARALWDAPLAQGRDRPRARELSKLAHDYFAATQKELGLAEVEAWLAADRSRER